SGSGTSGGSSSHAWICSATHGPTVWSSVSERPAETSSATSSVQKRDARDARSSARRRWSCSSRLAFHSSSPISPFVSTPVGSRDRQSTGGAAAYSSSATLSPQTAALPSSSTSTKD